MSCDLKVVMVSDCFMCGGREFQSLGAEQLNDRAPIVVSRDVGIHSSPAEVMIVTLDLIQLFIC